MKDSFCKTTLEDKTQTEFVAERFHNKTLGGWRTVCGSP